MKYEFNPQDVYISWRPSVDRLSTMFGISFPIPDELLNASSRRMDSEHAERQLKMLSVLIAKEFIKFLQEESSSDDL